MKIWGTMKKAALALIISSLLTLNAFAEKNETLQQMLKDRNIQGIEEVLSNDPNNGEAHFAAALYYSVGDDKLNANKDVQRQLEYLKKSADLGFAEGQLQYGFYLLNQGKGEEGLQYLEKSASQNYVQAMTLLGDLYFAGYQDPLGNSVIDRNADQAIKYLSQAIEQNSQDARYTLAYVYLDPDLGQKDIQKAIELLEANIDYKDKTGHLSSIVALIDIYEGNPDLVTRASKLQDYYYLASLQEYIPAVFIIGMLQREGGKGEKIEIPKDLEAAFKNLLKAANAGYLEAMFRIGEMYFKGEGTQQSDSDAYIWMAIAEELSNSETKYSETILELVPRKERQIVMDKKDHQLQFFSKDKKPQNISKAE